MCCSCRLLRGLGKETVKLAQSTGTGALHGSLNRLWACSKEAEFGLASPQLALTADAGIIFGLRSSITFSRLTGDSLSTLQAPRGLSLPCGNVLAEEPDRAHPAWTQHSSRANPRKVSCLRGFLFWSTQQAGVERGLRGWGFCWQSSFLRLASWG